MPIHIADWPPVYMDLRNWSTHHWLQGSPWRSSPREPEEQIIFQRFVRQGDIVYDIGANIGLHTALLSKLVGATGHVYAFEPNPALAPGLRCTIAGMANATLFEVALSAHAGEATLYVAEEDDSLSSLKDWTAGRFQTSPVVCEQIALDSLAEAERLPLPNFIKCDVEGAELDVFQGGSSILNKSDAPVVLFEANLHTALGFGRSLSAARDFLAELPAPEFRFFHFDDDQRMLEVSEISSTHSNILAIPKLVLESRVELSNA